MTLYPHTLRGQLSFMIAVMGIIGLITSVLIVNLFLNQIIEDQRLYSLDRVKQETMAQIAEHSSLLERVGRQLLKTPQFIDTLEQKKILTLPSLLFNQNSGITDSIRSLLIQKINILNDDFTLSAELNLNTDAKIPSCLPLMVKINVQNDNSLLEPLRNFCAIDSIIYQSITIPFKYSDHSGFLQIVSEAKNMFYILKNKLAMPFKISDHRNLINHKSDDWNTHKTEHLIELVFPLEDFSEKNNITITYQKDISHTIKSFSTSRLLIIVIVSCITGIGIILFLFIFERSMLNPLNRLSQQLEVIRKDKSNFGKQLKLEGSPEIKSLTENFNELTKRLASLYHKLEDMAFTDQLTSLPNRSRLQEILEFHTSLNLRDNTPFTLFMMDLDRFKSVNDTLGHHAGDILLQQVSERLDKILRKSDYFSLVSQEDVHLYKSDIVARLGGDEFAAILPAVGNTDEAIKIANKILDVMGKNFLIDSSNLNVGMSIGIVICPNHGQSSEVLMQHADAAMYRAKKNHDGYSVYDATHDSRDKKLLTLDVDLRQAINENELSLAYQPKIDLRSQKVVGVETLLRWTHKDQGFISPDKFIPIAEQSELIDDVTDWVILNSLSQKEKWDEQGISLTLSINLSPRNLMNKNFVKKIEKQLKLNRIAPESIYFELTETAVMSDPSHAIIVLRQLYDMGIRISIDDFGTGYSSLSYLKKLPIDEIKIDRSFVMDMEHDGNDAIIVQSTIDLAHNMGLRVIAEGVESQFVLDDLEKRTCDLAQGFHMAKPMNNHDLLVWLKTSPWGMNKNT